MTRNPPMSEAKPQRSIILSADEVRAVMAGRAKRKMRIRCPLNRQPPSHAMSSVIHPGDGSAEFYGRAGKCCGIVRCPYRVGDRLWAKEALRRQVSAYGVGIGYVADGLYCLGGPGSISTAWHVEGGKWPWKKTRIAPSLCPRWASRITVEIKAIRVEKTEAGIWEWVLDVTKASHP